MKKMIYNSRRNFILLFPFLTSTQSSCTVLIHPSSKLVVLKLNPLLTGFDGVLVVFPAFPVLDPIDPVPDDSGSFTDSRKAVSSFKKNF